MFECNFAAMFKNLDNVQCQTMLQNKWALKTFQFQLETALAQHRNYIKFCANCIQIVHLNNRTLTLSFLKDLKSQHYMLCFM